MLNRFRWVFCQLDRLRRCLSPRIRQALDELPETLDETYERTLLDIDKDNWAYAHRLFQCIVVARRPLRVEELAEFLAFESGEGGRLTFHEDWRPEDPRDTVLSTCSSLIAVVNADDSPVIQFSHFSVKEYLTSTRIAEGRVSRHSIPLEPAHLFVTQACLSFLLQLDKHVTKEHIEGTPLSRYAGRYWTDHAEFENVSSDAEDMIKTLFDPKSHHFANWVWIYDTISGRSLGSRALRRPERAPLHHAAHHGFHRVAEWLITTCAQDVNVSHDSWTPLNIASRKGRFMVVQVLLKHYASVDANNTTGWTPLHWASWSGYPKIARVLLEHGADVNIKSRTGRTPLRLLSDNSGNLEVAQMLLEHGADPNARSITDKDPLYVALEKGHPGLAQLLLEHGGDTNARGVGGRTLLHVSSRKGDWKVAQELLNLDVDINSRDNQGQTPLHVALEKGRKKVAQLLLDHGAESTPPLQVTDAETQVRVPALNDSGSLYDTLQAATTHYGVMKRHALMAGIRDIRGVGGSDRSGLRVFRVIHPANQRNVTSKNWSAVRRRWLGVKTRCVQRGCACFLHVNTVSVARSSWISSLIYKECWEKIRSAQG
jgi:ankyrin repeat protein